MADTLTHSGALIEPGRFYVAKGLPPEWYTDGEHPFIVSLAHGGSRLVVWGFSVYRREPDYRTLDADLRAWLDRHSGVVVHLDRDLRLDQRPKVPRRRARATVSAWLLATADRWERALAQDPPDFAAIEDMPATPGDVTIADVIAEVRALAKGRP